jgi:hypothetical protein
MVDLEFQVADTKRNLDAMVEVYRLLQEEGLAVSPSLFADQENLSGNGGGKYASMGMSKAIYDVLKTFPRSTGSEVATELQRNGFKTTQKNYKLAVHNKLSKLAKHGKIEADKQGGDRIRYSVPAQ